MEVWLIRSGGIIVARKRGRGRGAPWTRPLCVYTSSTRVINLINHHWFAACVHTSIVADTRRETRFADRRENAGSFVCVRNRGSEWLARPQPEALPARKPERLISSAKVRNVQRSAGIRSKLVLHPGRPWPVNRIQKEIIRVENFVAEILVRLAVDGACTSFGAEIGYTA